MIGGGFAAAEESVFLTKYARHVTVLIREDDFTCAKATADVAKAHEKITILTNVEVELVSGDSSLRLLKYRNRKTGEVTGMFLQREKLLAYLYSLAMSLLQIWYRDLLNSTNRGT